MPQAVLHILVPLILAALFKDWYDKRHKKKFPLIYVLIAGVAGLAPDLDVLAFWFLHFFDFSYEAIHRTFAHSLLIPAIFLVLAIFIRSEVRFRRQILNTSTIFSMICFGAFTHMILDATLVGSITPLAPFSNLAVGLDLAHKLPDPLSGLFVPSLEAALLVIWLIYLEFKHKISDFI